MRSLKPVILFALSFFFAVEVFLYFNLYADIITIVPAALVFAGVVTALRNPVVELYKRKFHKGYKPKKYRYRHRSSHSRHRHHNKLSGSTH